MRTLESILDQQPNKTDDSVLQATIIEPLAFMMAYDEDTILNKRDWLVANWKRNKFSFANGVLTLGKWPSPNGPRTDTRFLDWTNLTYEERKDFCKNVKELRIQGNDGINIFVNIGKGGENFPGKIIANGFKRTFLNIEESLENVYIKGSDVMELSPDADDDIHIKHIKDVQFECNSLILDYSNMSNSTHMSFKNVQAKCKSLLINWLYRQDSPTQHELSRLKGLRLDGVKNIEFKMDWPAVDMRAEISKCWRSWDYTDETGKQRCVMEPWEKMGLPWFMKIAPKSCSTVTVNIADKIYTFTKTPPTPQATAIEGWYASYSKS